MNSGKCEIHQRDIIGKGSGAMEGVRRCDDLAHLFGDRKLSGVAKETMQAMVSELRAGRIKQFVQTVGIEEQSVAGAKRNGCIFEFAIPQNSEGESVTVQEFQPAVWVKEHTCVMAGFGILDP